MEFFNLILGSTISGVVSSAVGAMVRVFSECPTCSQEDDRKIANLQSNHLDCSNCHKEVEQFTNVCDYTVDPATRRIGLVGVQVADLNAERYSGFYRNGLLWLRKNHYAGHTFTIPIDVQLERLNGRSVVLDVAHRDFEDDTVLDSEKTVILARQESESFHHVHAPKGYRSKMLLEKGSIVACDISVQSEYKDILFAGRRLLQLKE